MNVVMGLLGVQMCTVKERGRVWGGGVLKAVGCAVCVAPLTHPSVVILG